MNFAQLSLRSIAIAATLAAAATSSQALTIPSQGLVSDSVQQFSTLAMNGFNAVDITVEPKGNAKIVPSSVKDGIASAFSFPITKIEIGSKLNIASGAAVGSALKINRLTEEDLMVAITLANFTINYETKQVLADTTTSAGTVAQQPLYNFTATTPLALKYKFPLTVTGREVLGNLRLTDQAKASLIAGLQLPVFAVPLLNDDFGTLTQDITFNARKPAASTTPYKP
jgi:hypothetical protein